MKVVVFALTLLLALGCHARSMQDAPSLLDNYKTTAVIYLDQVKNQASQVLGEMSGVKIEEYRMKLAESLDNLQKYAESSSTSLQPFAAQLAEGTQTARNFMMKELKDLQDKVRPHRDELRQTIEKHLDEYERRFVPIFREYFLDNQKEIESLREKLQPAIEDLKSKLVTNLEETKTKLAPIVETVRGKLTERLQNLKDLASPVAEEYKEHMMKAVEDVKEKLAPHTVELKDQIEPYVETLRTKLMSIYENAAQVLQA